MKFSTTVESLATSLKTAIKTISKNPRFAVLQYLHLRAKDDSVMVATTDLTTFTRVTIPADVSTPGEILAPAKLTADIVKVLPASEIEIKANADDYDQTFTISAGTGSRTISGMNPDEFPVFPEIDPKSVKSLICDSHEFIRAFKAVSKYAHPDGAAKQSLAGVHLSGNRLWSSDGYRIGYSDITCVGDSIEAILQPNLIAFLGDICPQNKLISIDFTDDYVRVITSHGEVVQRTIEGENLAHFTGPVGSTPEIELELTKFRNLIDLADIANNGEQNYILLKVSEDGTELQIAGNYSEDSILLEKPSLDMAGKVCAIDSAKALSLIDSLKVHKSESSYILPRTVKVRLGDSLIAIIAGEYNLTDLIKLKYPSVKEAKKALGIKASNWQALAHKIHGNTELLSKLILPNVVQTGTTPYPISRDQEIKIRGFGFAPAWDLPYEYNESCLTVIESKHGFTQSEPLPPSQHQDAAVTLYVIESSHGFTQSEPLPPSQPYVAPQTYQEELAAHKAARELERKMELETVRQYYQSEPVELLQAALVGGDATTERLIKKHYKTLREFKARFLSDDNLTIRTWVDRKQRSWKQAADSYEHYARNYRDIITDIITQHQSQHQPTNTASVVTVEELKAKYVRFKDAKESLKLKASSWQVLADKINLANKPNSELKEYATTEMVVVQLKAKYGKLSNAKAALKIKAASWQKLAAAVMAA